MSDNNTQERISVSDINPLIGEVSHADTINNVRAVLGALGELKPTEEASLSEDFNFRMYLIYSWLRYTLKYFSEHPDVKHVVPVVEEVKS